MIEFITSTIKNIWAFIGSNTSQVLTLSGLMWAIHSYKNTKKIEAENLADIRFLELSQRASKESLLEKINAISTLPIFSNKDKLHFLFNKDNFYSRYKEHFPYIVQSIDIIINIIESNMKNNEPENKQLHKACIEALSKISHNTKNEIMFNKSKQVVTGIVLENNLLEHMNFNYAYLAGSNFKNTKLRYGKFKKTDFTHSNLSEAKLNASDFSKARLHYTDFSNADLSDAVLNDSKILSVIFDGANLSRTKFNGANLSHSRFKNNTDLYDIDFSNAKFENFELYSSKILNSKFNKAFINENSKILKTSFESVDFMNAVCENLVCKDTSFLQVDFEGTIFINCTFNDVSFTNCKFNDTTFENCVFNSTVPRNLINGSKFIKMKTPKVKETLVVNHPDPLIVADDEFNLLDYHY